ncbi:MAG TPA: hypothetical protein VIO64_13370 [Pseudobacteroides sp.]|uniref:hypothetical protein n=1 Tax=Pseudobacteroides sp. TaxID=1968840 RepID=UPI002F92762B
MTKLLKYEFLRSSKVILISSAIIILFNLVLLLDISLSLSEALAYFLSLIGIAIFSIMMFYEIGIFRKDFINCSPNIIQLVPRSAFQIIGTKIFKAFICISLYYSIMVIFSLINSKAYINNYLIFYSSYNAVPMIGVVFWNLIFLMLDLLLIGILSLIIAHRVSIDRKKALVLASMFGVLTIVLIAILLTSISIPFAYSDNIYECESLAVVFAILFSLICLILDNKRILSKSSIKFFAAPILLIIIISSVAQAVTYSNRVIEKIDYPFENDRQAIGKWESIGRVDDMDSFNPAKNRYITSYPQLEKINIMTGGKTDASYISWTRNMLVNHRLSTVNPYNIRTYNGIKYMFVEWKNEEFVYEHIKPFYLVLQQK